MNCQDSGRYASTHEIGHREKLDPRYIQRVLKYALLAPDIIESILYDQIPDGLAVRNYTNKKIPGGFVSAEGGILVGLMIS